MLHLDMDQLLCIGKPGTFWMSHTRTRRPVESGLYPSALLSKGKNKKCKTLFVFLADPVIGHYLDHYLAEGKTLDQRLVTGLERSGQKRGLFI